MFFSHFGHLEKGSSTCKVRPACTDKDYFYTHTACDAQGEVGSRLRAPVPCSLHLTTVQAPVASKLTRETPKDQHGEPRLDGNQEHGLIHVPSRHPLPVCFTQH